MPDHNTAGEIYLGRQDATSNFSRYNSIRAYNSSTQESNYIAFKIHNGTTDQNGVGEAIERLRIRGDGNEVFL